MEYLLPHSRQTWLSLAISGKLDDSVGLTLATLSHPEEPATDVGGERSSFSPWAADPGLRDGDSFLMTYLSEGKGANVTLCVR